MNIDLSTPAKRYKYWNAKAKEILVGRTIKSARYMTEEEAEEGGLRAGLVITLDNGTELLPMSDDEGNDVGALHYYTATVADCLPVMG